MRISIIGMGYVGAVSAGCLADCGHEVIGVDVSPEKVAMFNDGVSPIVEPNLPELIAQAVACGRLRAIADAEAAVAQSEVTIISVGTPSAADGSVSLATVDAVARTIGAAIFRKSAAHTVVMRSTVPPGTAEERVIPLLEQYSGRRLGRGLFYCSNPEFLREGSAVKDFRTPPFTLVGTPEGDDGAAVRALYADIDAPIHRTSLRVAESVKHISNVYHALKIAFANEAGAVLAACGVDSRAAFQLFAEDRMLNISPAYLRPGFAFGGSCLPKDVRSFVALAGQLGVATPVLSQLMPGNLAVVERAYQAVARHGRLPVALFGLAFKPHTDDMRESPFVLLAERLIGKGFDLRIFDRSVNMAALLGANRTYIEQEIPHLDRLLAVNPAQALRSARIVVVGHVVGEDRAALIEALDGQVVIDLAGISELRSHQRITYQGFCW